MSDPGIDVGHESAGDLDDPAVLPPLPRSRLRHSRNSPEVPCSSQLGRYHSPRRAASVAREAISLSVQALFTPTRVGDDRSSRASSVARSVQGDDDASSVSYLEFTSPTVSI